VPTGELPRASDVQKFIEFDVAVPHRLIQDDIHEGYFIPKGALVIPNVWYVLSFTLV